MFRPVTSAAASKLSFSTPLATALRAQQRRAFGGAHHHDAHALPKNPQAMYADGFHHPMNYQGHVPVTPKKFETDWERTKRQNSHMPYYPLRFIAAGVISIPITAVLAQEFIFYQEGNPLSGAAHLLQNVVQLQDNKVDYSNLKNVYQTEEFQKKLQEYVAQRQ